MRTILRTTFGSHLYGTSTPNSDFDYKSIFVPTARDIVLRKKDKVINQQRPKGFGEKNYAGEEEEEAFSVQKYLELLAEGQTVALDILFTPEEFILDGPSEEWLEIVANKDKLITRQASSFVGYCRQQASKYGVKGARLAAARAAFEFLDKQIKRSGTEIKLEKFQEKMTDLTFEHPEYLDFISIDQTNSTPIIHWSVCGRKLPFNTSLRNAYNIISKLVNDYGSRAIQAEQEGGIDWKALSHSVRIANEAIELLSTGKITLPLPNAEYILSIKQGKLPYKIVAEEIEDLVETVEAGIITSVLLEKPDQEWIDNFIFKIHKEEILNG